MDESAIWPESIGKLHFDFKMEEMHIKNSKKLPKSNNMSSKSQPTQNNLREILDRIGKLSYRYHTENLIDASTRFW